jgi:preprotein translocase subunit SecE
LFQGAIVAKPTDKPVKVEEKAKPAPRPAEKKNSLNFFQRTGRKLRNWWIDTLGELRKVSWPTLPQARRLSWIVLATMFAMSILLGGLDWLFSKLIGWIVAG